MAAENTSLKQSEKECGYFIDWPGVCHRRESIRTYAVNCNDAWLNTEGDDISGSYVKYKDHQEVVAALEAKCAELAAENAVIKSAIPEPRDIEDDNDNMDDVSLAEDFGFNHAIELMRRRIPETPATDAFLAEVRAQGVEMAMEHMQSSGSLTFGDCYISLNEFAAELRKGGNQ
ncbi:hypothetical protein OU670_10785 [Escherichia coli]|nr:hypothetical protein [Escherichia coli]